MVLVISVVYLSFLLFFKQNAVDLFDQNEPSVDQIKRSVTDMEPMVEPQILQPVSRLCTDNVDKFNKVRSKLKEKDGQVSKELVDAEKFADNQSVLDSKQKSLEPLLEKIKNTKKDPDSVKEGLEDIRDFVIIVEEILEIIIVLEEILVVVKPRCQSNPKVTKEVEDKEKQLADTKKKCEHMLNVVRGEEKKLQELQQQNKELDKHIQDLTKWLPSVEGEIVKRTPVSANYNILKKQQEENQVSGIFAILSLTCFYIFLDMLYTWSYVLCKLC